MTATIKTTFTGLHEALFINDQPFNKQWMNLPAQEEVFAGLSGLLYHDRELGVNYFSTLLVFDTEENARDSGMLSRLRPPNFFINVEEYLAYMATNNIEVVQELIIA